MAINAAPNAQPAPLPFTIVPAPAPKPPKVLACPDDVTLCLVEAAKAALPHKYPLAEDDTVSAQLQSCLQLDPVDLVIDSMAAHVCCDRSSASHLQVLPRVHPTICVCRIFR